MHHEAKDAHLSGTAIVELDGLLLVEGLLVPARGAGLGLLDVGLAHSEATLDGSDSEQGAEHGLGREGGKGGNAGGDLGQIVAGGEGLGQAVAGSGHKVAEDGKLGDTAVLGLHVAEAVEAILVSVLEQAKRVPEAKRGLGTDLGLEAHLHGRRASNAGHGGESGGRAEGKEDGSAIGVEIGRGVL